MSVVLSGQISEKMDSQTIAQEIRPILEGLNKKDKAFLINWADSGVFIIQAEKEFFKFLKDHGVVVSEAHAIAFYESRFLPSFLIVQRLSLKKSFSDSQVSLASDSIVRHEFHHLIWDFLERSGATKRCSEKEAAASTAFNHLRSELIAYILENPWRLRTIEPEFLCYSKDKEILEKTQELRDIASLSIDIGGRLGVSPRAFIFAAMEATNYEELKDKFTALVPITSFDNEKMVKILFEAWNQPFARVYLAPFLKFKGFKFDEGVLRSFILRKLDERPLPMRSFGVEQRKVTVQDLFDNFNLLARFAAALGVSISWDDEIKRRLIEPRLLLPRETAQTILGMEIPMRWILLEAGPEQFLSSLIDPLHVNEEKTYQIYSQIIKSSPAMQKAFQEVLDDIIEKTKEFIRKEFSRSSDDSREKKNQEFQKGITSLRKLLIESNLSPNSNSPVDNFEFKWRGTPEKEMAEKFVKLMEIPKEDSAALGVAIADVVGAAEVFGKDLKTESGSANRVASWSSVAEEMIRQLKALKSDGKFDFGKDGEQIAFLLGVLHGVLTEKEMRAFVGSMDKIYQEKKFEEAQGAAVWVNTAHQMASLLRQHPDKPLVIGMEEGLEPQILEGLREEGVSQGELDRRRNQGTLAIVTGNNTMTALQFVRMAKQKLGIKENEGKICLFIMKEVTLPPAFLNFETLGEIEDLEREAFIFFIFFIGQTLMAVESNLPDWNQIRSRLIQA